MSITSFYDKIKKIEIQGDFMKLLIASDIHGSLKYCKKIVEQYEKENCDYPGGDSDFCAGGLCDQRIFHSA